ncbi:MAG: FtsX-like permease family protein, partial [Planctomycetota bacterium]|nr:FtsX-like permease family protein [Planctomycetota bacterium]
GYDKDFRRVQAASDLTEGEKRFSSVVSAAGGTYFVPKIICVSEFDKIDLIGLTEPLTLTPITGMNVIDAQQDAVPRHYGEIGVDASGSTKPQPKSRVGVASVFIEPGRGFKLRAGSGLVINTNPDHPQGEGFESDIGIIRNVVLTSADDLWSLTETRLDLLQKKGVRNETAAQFQHLAREKIDEAHKAEKAGQNDRLMVAAERGRGLAYQSYTRGLSTINDLIKAVVIFLALIIPFCFFVTKLLSPWDDINRQLAMFGGVFVAMAVTLRLVHPAFEVARTPEVVILAFIIMGLAGFVAAILVGRFNSTMTQAIEESQLAESVEAPQGRLAGVAFLVGVNNMKRRRIRTSLTCATVVLVTFTMLSVISVGQDIEPAVIRASGEAPYSGFLFTQAGLGAIDPVRLDRMRANYQGEGMQSVARAWAQRLGTYSEYLPYEIVPAQPVAGAPVKVLSAKVLLGLEKAEDGFLKPMPIAPGGRWFSSDNAAEIAISIKAAALLGITPENMSGRVLQVVGRPLKLVALLDDEALEATRDMAEAPFLPLLAQASQNATEAAGGAASSSSSANLADMPGVEIARPVDIAFVPLGLARSMGDAEFRTLSVKFTGSAAESSRRAWDEANELIQFQTARVAVGITEKIIRDRSQQAEAAALVSASPGAAPKPAKGEEAGLRPVEAGQYQMTSSSSTEVGGVIKIAIPIILAGTIILNTMLGSVMERRREVAIYNAIGLNPGHVMTFFLAESLVFGMVGSVAGYLIGQILSLAVTRFNLPLNLNYSSLSVMVVIFLTIATVLLSTVYPAMMAARAAVPSGQRRWSLPQPVGDQIFVQFPFSYDASRVLGICAYLRDYMKQNSEASTGKFLAKLGPVGRVPTTAPAPETPGTPGTPGAAGSPGKAADGRAYAMVFDIAPAPFDLGVNQKMEIYAYYDPRVKAHMLAVHLTRTSGEVGNWVTVNQPFLEALRKRLLGWRSQKAATHEAFYRDGERLFADALNLPVVGPGSERV